MRTGNDRLTGRLCALGCETLFGLSYLFTRRVTQTQSGFALLGWRFLVALAAMGVLALTGCVRIRLRGRDVWPLLRVALLSPCLYFIGETVGISRTTASESGAFLACIPVVSLAASAVVLKKRPTYLQTAGILVTLLGVLATVLAVGFASSLSVSGYAFCCLPCWPMRFTAYTSSGHPVTARRKSPLSCWQPGRLCSARSRLYRPPYRERWGS